MKVLTDTGLAYYHSKLQNEFISNGSLSDAIDDYLDNVNWVEVIGNTYVTSEDVADMISSADLDAYLQKAGGTMTGSLNSKRINNQFNFSKGTTPSSINYAAMYFADKDGEAYGKNCLGLVECSVDANNKVSTYIRAVKNEANSTVACSITASVDANGNAEAKVNSNTIATFDSNNKLVFPNGNTIWFA